VQKLLATYLVIVLYQTHISREALFAAKESLDAARESIEISIKARQLDSLPEARRFIIPMHTLTEWQEDLEEIRQDLETAVSKRDDALIETMAKQRGLDSPKGLLQKFWYEPCPRWLQIIWDAGARHYYFCKTIVPLLWDAEKNSPSYYTVEEVISRCNRSIHYITELRSFIKRSVPEAYLEAPAFRSNLNFFDDPN
jgi:hypothetical protein